MGSKSRNIFLKFPLDHFFYLIIQAAAYQAQKFRRGNKVQTVISVRLARVIEVSGQGMGEQVVFMLNRRNGWLRGMPLVSFTFSIKATTSIRAKLMIGCSALAVHEVLNFLQVFLMLFFLEDPGPAAIGNQNPGDTHRYSSPNKFIEPNRNRPHRATIATAYLAGVSPMHACNRQPVIDRANPVIHGHFRNATSLGNSPPGVISSVVKNLVRSFMYSDVKYPHA